MEVRYHGWSGVELVGEEVRIGFDLPYEAVEEWTRIDAPAALCVTHGHPDHCGLLTRLERREETDLGFDLVAPKVVAERFRHLWAGGPNRVRHSGFGDYGEVGPVTIERFYWQHLPLVPAEPGRAARFASRLLAHPVELLKIGRAALQLPLSSPMHGYVVEWPEGPTVVNYAEGLHDETTEGELEYVAETWEPDVVLAAVEPEHAVAVRRCLDRLDPREAYLYEAHRPWRETFGLPLVDLEEFARRVDDSRRYDVHAL